MKTKNRPKPAAPEKPAFIPVNQGGNSSPAGQILLGGYVPAAVGRAFRALAEEDGRTVSGMLNKLIPEILKVNGYNPETGEKVA